MGAPGRAVFLSVFLVASAALAFIAGEIFVRALGRYDADGTFVFRGRPVPPLALPIARARRLLEDYRAHPRGYMMYDSDLGWTNRPRACSEDRKYCANAEGLRADREYAREPPAGIRRIAIFGDSFIHGHDVDLSGSLAPQLEKALASRGVRAEALNFGVGGFGMDQAYLRYVRDGRRYRADVVVVGLQLENVARNLMVFRLIAFPQSLIPFSKPRFYAGGGALAAANLPTVAPERIPEVLANFDRSPLRRYETFYTDRYRPRWWQHSKLLALMAERTLGAEPDALAPGSEGLALTRAILGRFRAQVTADSMSFLLVYLPLRENLAAQLRGERDPWERFVAPLRCDFQIVDPTPRLLEIARRNGVGAVVPGHYTPEGNWAVAETLAEALAPRLR